VLTVHPFVDADLSALAELFAEMDRFYGATDVAPAAAYERQLRALLIREPPVAQVLVAYNHTALVGFASYSFLWPAAGLSSSVFLKELYVLQAVRGQGVGKALMQRLFQVAADTGCSRVEWMTEQTNVEARAFYERLGVNANTEKVFYRVVGETVAPRSANVDEASTGA